MFSVSVRFHDNHLEEELAERGSELSDSGAGKEAKNGEGESTATIGLTHIVSSGRDVLA